jgi:hypothetical protein
MSIAIVHDAEALANDPQRYTLTLPRPAKVFNDANPDIVIDGGKLVSLSGGG